MGTVQEQASSLRSLAEHFARDDWNYTRDIGELHSVRYDRSEDRPWGRLVRALGWLLRKQPAFAKGRGPNRFYMFWHALHRDRHLPDGQLAGGSILTFWEEDGEYLQYVQPSVGSLIADFLEADPEHPHAVMIAGEMKRINDSYGERIAARKVGVPCD